MSGKIFEKLTKQTFAAYVAQHDGIVLFHKKLCPHCAIMATVLEKVRGHIPLALAEVDSEEEPELMAEIGAERVPTLCAVRGGRIRAMFTGVRNPRETRQWYENA